MSTPEYRRSSSTAPHGPIVSRAWGPNLAGRPPLHFGSSAANPWALNAWITSRAYGAVIANIAAARNVTLTEVESTIEGEIDLLGILGLSKEVRNGYQQINVQFRLRGDDPEKLRDVVERSRQRSAVYDVITNGVPVAISVDAG